MCKVAIEFEKYVSFVHLASVEAGGQFSQSSTTESKGANPPAMDIFIIESFWRKLIFAFPIFLYSSKSPHS